MNDFLGLLSRNKWKVATGVVVATLLLATCASAETEIDRAPLSVTQERVLGEGDVEFFYTYNNEKDNGDVTASHDFGGLWAPFDFVTLSASTDYNDVVDNGFGDTFLNATLNVEALGLDVRPAIGVSIPNGFTESPTPVDQRSSGTFDFQPAVAVIADLEAVPGGELGFQYVGTFRTGVNDLDFTYGDQHTLKGWLAVQAFEFATLYGLVEGRFNGSTLVGTDFLDSAQQLTLLESYETVNVGAGAHTYLAGFRVSGEVAVPIHESRDLEQVFDEQRVFRLGVQRTF